MNESVDGIRVDRRADRHQVPSSYTVTKRQTYALRARLAGAAGDSRSSGRSDVVGVASRNDGARGCGGSGTAWWNRREGRLGDGRPAIARAHRIVLAGGLTPDNVVEAIETVRPFGVDVSSGVEDSPGVKNVDKVARFLASARSAFDKR